MAEFAALGIASSILQVLDFGTRFVATAWQTSKSEHASLTDLEDLRKASKSFRDVQHTLQSTLPASNTAIDSLIQKSLAISGEMTDSLDKIWRGRNVLHKAWLAVWKEEKLKALETRLREMQVELTFHMAVDLRSAVRDSAEKQDQILQELRDARSRVKTPGSKSSEEETATIDESRLGYGGSIVECLTDGLQLHEQIKSELISDLIANIYRSEEAELSLSDIKNIHLPHERKIELEQLFISRLCYDTMQERTSTIKDAHKGTFRWIFEDNSTTSFKDWLVSDRSLYWITGKPGSGKSTLMKYLLQPINQSENDINDSEESTTYLRSSESAARPQGRCEKYLQQWAGDEHNLTIVSFHFWAIGSELQKSQEGLFRTLLVQLLRAHPEVIPMIAPLRWESLCLFNVDPKRFTQIELCGMFQQAIVHTSARAKLAVFIDGLDEFEGDCLALISLVQKCLASPVKICVSSRPWIEFEGAFGGHPRLKMEDLTYEDISNYVSTKFKADARFESLQRRQPHIAKKLIKSVVEKSSGVFLWVSIVVASLMAGLGAGDRVEDLQKRLELLPAEIKNLYKSILKNIDYEYREHTAQLLELMAVFKPGSSPLLFWYADEANFMDRCIKEDISTVTIQEGKDRVEDVRRRLGSRCKGLLEIHDHEFGDYFSIFFGGHVNYLHKTVYEFLCSRKTQQRLRKYIKTPYDANIRAAAAYAAFSKGVKRAADITTKQRSRSFLVAIDSYTSEACLRSCLEHTANASLDSFKEVVRLIDQLTCAHHVIPNKLWMKRIRSKSLMFELSKSGRARNFASVQLYRRLNSSDKLLCLATESSVAEYVRVRAKPGGLVVAQHPTDNAPRSGIVHLAQRVLERLSGTNTVSLLSLVYLPHPRSASLLKCLLDKGAKPNMKIARADAGRVTIMTPWEEILGKALGYRVLDLADDMLENIRKCVRQMVDARSKVNLKTVNAAISYASTNIDGEEVYRCLKRMKADPNAQFEGPFEQ